MVEAKASESYPAIFTRPRGSGITFATFTAPVGEILAWTTIERLDLQGGGHQRIRKESKVRAITKFLNDDRNTIPSAVTIALKGVALPDTFDACSELKIPATDQPPGWVIDGQHRLYGMNACNPKMPASVVALINPSDVEIAFQFLVINNKVSKVSQDHLKLLALQYADEDLKERLLTARMNLGQHALSVGIVDNTDDSPFFHSVIWPVESSEVDGPRNNLVLPASVEQALGAIALKRLPDLEENDAVIDLFFGIWHAVKRLWPTLWNAQSKLLSKVGLVTLTMFIIDDLTPLADRGRLDLSDPDAVDKEIEDILSSLEPMFWTSEWMSKSLDTSGGRQIVVDALVQVRRNVLRHRPWDADVALVSAGQG